jgi:hypothetical protein
VSRRTPPRHETPPDKTRPGVESIHGPPGYARKGEIVRVDRWVSSAIRPGNATCSSASAPSECYTVPGLVSSGRRCIGTCSRGAIRERRLTCREMWRWNVLVPSRDREREREREREGRYIVTLAHADLLLLRGPSCSTRCSTDPESGGEERSGRAKSQEPGHPCTISHREQCRLQQKHEEILSALRIV